MGILNITPDSQALVGRHLKPEAALAHAEKMVAEGADMIDVGAEATNPQLNPNLSLQEELDRLLPVIRLLKKHITVPISVDTSKPEVMRAVAELGVSLINDVRALRYEEALATVAELQIPVCLMHMQYPSGKPNDAKDELGEEVVSKVMQFLDERINVCINAGIKRENIIIDPGIGHGNFGKNLKQNLMLLKHLEAFKKFKLPILVGASRKTFIGKLLNESPEKRLYGSIAAGIIAAQNGANILRVHDVLETVQALKVVNSIAGVN